MSAFECNITPTRVKNVRKVMDNREPTIVTLGPFTPKAIVQFEDVPVSKTARRFLVIQNSFAEEVQVKIGKQPKPELNITLEWTNNTIPAGSEVSMELVWIPLKVEACRETLQFLDQCGTKKDVSIILKSCDLKKNAKRPGVGNVPKKLKMKNPSPPKFFKTQRSVITKRTSIVETVHVQKTTHLVKSPLGERIFNTNIDEINFSRVDRIFEVPDKVDYHPNQENVSPNTPVNASSLFDNIRFTPATETKSKSTSKLEFLASLPTPQGPCREDYQMNAPTRRNLISNGISPEHNRISLSKQATPLPEHFLLAQLETPNPTVPKVFVSPTASNVPLDVIQETPQPNRNQLFIPSRDSTISKKDKPKPTAPEVTNELNLNSIDCSVSSNTYIKYDDQENASCNEIELEVHLVEQQVLEAISEEDSKGSSKNLTHIHQKTFNIDKKSLSEDDISVSKDESGLRKKILSESMREFGKDIELIRRRSNQGSLPNLTDDVVDSIATNRFYFQQETRAHPNLSMESIVSTSEFKEGEINAQSSLFNINEIGLQNESKQTVEIMPTENENLNNKNVETLFESPKGRVRQLADSPILACSPTLRRVTRTDAVFKSPLKKGAMLTFSPPKVKRLCNDVLDSFQTAPMGREIRTNTWKQPSRPQQSKFQVPKPPGSTSEVRHSTSLTSLANVSQTSIASASSVCTPRKKYREDHVTMYNPECHLIGDPFAATTTQDPFLSSTMYLDERSVDRIEKQFKKWLNALVTIPAELESDENQKIDIGKLFQEVQKQDLRLAPSREVVSSKYYKTRIDSLRSQAISFFKTEAVVVPMQKVARQIEDQAISIRTDKSIQLDLVLQRHILELLLCFNPLWLRIGLEVVFGVQLDLNSNHDIIGLSRFIVQRMFKDPYLEQKYGKNFKKSEELQKQMRKHQLKKFLFVLFFLDRAKEARLIKHNPCLFVKNAPYKETIEILKKFASLCLANFGDIVKFLKRVGYVLTHKQTYIDEFDYAFSRLGVDLRDGIRLTKVMEVILLRDDLTKRLRVPAISRLQKIHNVELGLTALRDAEYKILGDITAKDIADGHREKTLSLLWQIIYKFRAPRFNAAATIIQKWWRSIWLRIFINRNIKIKREIKMNLAATVIQKTFRGFQTRKMVKSYIVERKCAVSVIQRHFRGFLARKETMQKKQSIVIIQRWFRSVTVTRKIRIEYQMKKMAVVKIQKWHRRHLLARKLMASANVVKEIKEDAKMRYQKSVIIQRTLKSYVIRKRLRNTVEGIVRFQRQQKLKNQCASKIQSLWKMRTTRREFLQLKSVTIKIQLIYRRKLLARKERNEFLVLRESTVKIQRWMRACCLMKHEKMKYLESRKRIIKIQQKYRAKLLARQERKKFELIKRVTIRVQRRYRAKQLMKLDRNQYLLMKKSAIAIQQRFRALTEMRKVRGEFLEYKARVLLVQRKFRANQLAKQARAEYLILKAKATFVQQVFRGKLKMRAEQANYLKLRNAVVTIQLKLRATMLMKQQQAEYLKLKEAVMHVQQRYKATRQMRQERQHFLQLKKITIKIQQRFRATKLMQEEFLRYSTLQYYTSFIQQQYRAMLKMRVDRKNYQQLRETTIKIQRIFRGKLLMRVERNRYLQLKKAVLYVQERRRAILKKRCVKKDFQELKKAAICMQRQFRAQQSMKLQRAEYLRMKWAIKVTESRYTAMKEMIKFRQDFQALKRSAIFVQRRFRANVTGSKQRRNFLGQKEAAIKIQNYYRGHLLKKKEMETLKNVKAHVVWMQSKFRAQLAMKRERTRFLELKSATTILQVRFRAQRAMKIQRELFLQQKQAAIKIQRRFRETQQMKMDQKQYQVLRTAAVKIQQKWKAILEMRKERENYLMLLKYTKCVQMRFRANRAMKQQQGSFMEKKYATIKIQQYFRGYLETRKLSGEYQKLKTATMTIQRKLRATILRNQTHKHFMEMRVAACKIQTIFRGYRLMKQQREEYLILRQTTISIQSRFHGLLAMKKQRLEFLHMKKCCQLLQAKWKATLQMRQERAHYLKLKAVTIRIQQKFRATKMMRQQRQEFLQLKQSVKIIQVNYRALIAMRSERAKYLELKQASVIIQQRYRALMLARRERVRFLELKEAALIMQTCYRARLAMIEARTKFQEMKMACVKIQRFYRGFKLMLAQRKYFSDLKIAVRRVEDRYIANKQMLVERERYQRLRQTVVFVQQHIRNNRESRKCRESYEKLKNSVVGLQSHIRGFLARRRVEHLKTPEMVELRRRNRAARVLQAFYRGYYARKKFQTRSLREIAMRLMKANQNLDPSQTLQSKLHMSIKFLRGKYNVAEAFTVLTRMEYMSRITPHLLIPHATFVAGFCYGIMGHAIRSEIDKQIIELCSCIILNLSRYKYTRANAFQESGLSTVAQMLLRWCDKDCGIFNTLCTLIYVFAHYEHHKRKICQFLTTPDAIYILRQIRQLVARKEKMRQNSRRPIGFISISLQANNKKDSKQTMLQQQVIYGIQNDKEVPALEPDYGVAKKKPYIFYSSVFAFDSILSKLSIDI